MVGDMNESLDLAAAGPAKVRRARRLVQSSLRTSVLAESRFPAARRWAWGAAAVLAALAIVGFLYSRAIGFPQMHDHVGEWNELGLTSLAFEATIVVVSVGRLLAHERNVNIAAPVRGAAA
jgi:hypothetical protein